LFHYCTQLDLVGSAGCNLSSKVSYQQGTQRSILRSLRLLLSNSQGNESINPFVNS
jgi:hypothetical protein